MLREHFNELCKVAEERKPYVMAKIAEEAKAPPSAEPETDYMQLGKSYAPSIGYGAGAGYLAGMPIGLLAHAIFGKDRGLRGYLRSALLGGLVGGGLGALGGGGARYLYRNTDSGKEYGDKAIDSIAGLGDYFGDTGKEYGASFGQNAKRVLGADNPSPEDPAPVKP